MKSTPKVWKHADLATSHQRVAAWCQWFNLPEPDLPTDEEGLLLIDGLLDWLIANSISIDWIVAGEDRHMGLPGQFSVTINTRCFYLRLEQRDRLVLSWPRVRQIPFARA